MNRYFLQRLLDDARYQPMLGEIMLRSQLNTFKQVFFMGDTTTVRALLMVASIWQAIAFLLPINMLDRPFYSEMRFMPGWAWGVLFLLHSGAVWSRFRDHQNRPTLGYIVNGYGFFLWLFVCILETMGVQRFSAAMGMEWTVICAAFGALIRTGDKDDRTSA